MDTCIQTRITFRINSRGWETEHERFRGKKMEDLVANEVVSRVFSSDDKKIALSFRCFQQK